MTRCPTCDSPDPKRHPAVQYEGEVEICKDAFHLGETAVKRRVVRDFIDRGRAAGHDALGVANDPEWPRPSDDQMWTPHPVGAPNPLASREEHERARREALRDIELARAMLIDIRDSENDPTSPINFNPMRNMLARLCRSVLRAYNQPDPTKE